MSFDFLEVRLIDDLLVSLWVFQRSCWGGIPFVRLIWFSNFEFLVHIKPMIPFSFLDVSFVTLPVNHYVLFRIRSLKHELIFEIDFIFLRELMEFKSFYFLLTTLENYILTIVFFNSIFDYLGYFERIRWEVGLLRWIICRIAWTKVSPEISILL